MSKRSEPPFEVVYDFENLYRAYRTARKGKRWKNPVARVEAGALEAVKILQTELSQGTYKPGGYTEFTVYEPKERRIQTNSFKDKIIQHSLCDNILYPILSAPFILDNYGSQVGKGTHFGLDRLRGFMLEYYRRHGSADGWVLKCDVRHYFASIRHDILKRDVRHYLKDPRTLALVDLIIDSTPGNVGIPIGNQSSQIFALLYLDPLDHFIKEVLQVRYYGRYMDDFYLIFEKKEDAQRAWRLVSEFLAPRGLELNAKTNIFPLRNGLDFLGFHTYLTETGKVIRKVRRSSKGRMSRKLRKYGEQYRAGEKSRKEIEDSYRSWRAHASHGNCRNLVLEYDQRVQRIFHPERSERNAEKNQHPGNRPEGPRPPDQV